MNAPERTYKPTMEIIADLHTHTLASTHAFNTVTEMARRAQELGHWALAVTDHGPAMPDAPHPWHFYNMARLPDFIEGVWLLRGIEANVLNAAGTLDFTAEQFSRMHLDWVVASMHNDIYDGGRTFAPVEEVTALWLNVAKDPQVDMIGHCERPNYAFDYDRVAREFAHTGKVVELNANSAVVRPGGEETMKQLVLACKKHDVLLALNSDGHSIYHLGQVKNVAALAAEVEYPKELIVNASRKNLARTLREHGRAIAEKMEADV